HTQIYTLSLHDALPISMRAGEKHGQTEHRRRLLDGLSGRVVELGAGSGINFRHYPASVNEVVAVEPEEYLRGLAEQAAATEVDRSEEHTSELQSRGHLV